MLGSIVGAVAGPVLGKVLGGGKKGASQTQSSTVSYPTWLDPFLQKGYTDILDMGWDAINNPLKLNIAGFTPDQLSAFEKVRQTQGQFAPFLQEALTGTSLATNRALEGYSPEMIQGAMNPYEMLVADERKKRAVQDADRRIRDIGDAAIQAGAFGGGRHGVKEAMAEEDLANRLAAIDAESLNQAYENAIKQLNFGTTTGISGSGQLAQTANLGQGMNLQDIAALENIGLSQQNLQQKQNQSVYDQSMDERNRLTFMANLLGQPANAYKAGTTATYGDPTKQALGYGMLGSEIFNQSGLSNLIDSGISSIFGGGGGNVWGNSMGGSLMSGFKG